MISNAVLRVWSSVNNASRHLNVTPQAITSAILGKTDNAGGYKWRVATGAAAGDEGAMDEEEEEEDETVSAQPMGLAFPNLPPPSLMYLSHFSLMSLPHLSPISLPPLYHRSNLLTPFVHRLLRLSLLVVVRFGVMTRGNSSSPKRAKSFATAAAFATTSLTASIGYCDAGMRRDRPSWPTKWVSQSPWHMLMTCDMQLSLSLSQCCPSITHQINHAVVESDCDCAALFISGLGKTVQVVSFLDHLFEVEKIHGPFLITVPLSTIEHWKRESEGWSQMGVCLYHDVGGGRDMRDVIRE